MTHPHSAQNKQGDGSIYAALAKVAPYGEPAASCSTASTGMHVAATRLFGCRPYCTVAAASTDATALARH